MDWSQKLNEQVTQCRLCSRLVEYRAEVARVKKREFRDWEYWGKPVPSFGDPNARLLIVGLAPGAHGANRTGRMFTGDSAGRWMYRALHRAGFANQPSWERRDDGLVLTDCYITAAIHCAPPGNKPLPAELANCRRYLDVELQTLPRLRVVVALGKIAFDAYLRQRGIAPRPAFAHNVCFEFTPTLIASYHPSRQNTNTGKLTEAMFDAVLTRARSRLG
jgi:uracil-DNA glycosylase family 4